MAYVFQGVEVYRHTSTLASKTRDWCNTNATLVYSGNSESYQDTGLTASTHYYYAIFSKYYDSETETNAYGSGAVADAVTEAAPSLYQEWASYPDSPELTSAYPYQCIFLESDSYVRLFGCSVPICVLEGTRIGASGAGDYYKYKLVGGIWTLVYTNQHTGGKILLSNSPTLYEANNDIYTDTTLTTIYFAKTTP